MKLICIQSVKGGCGASTVATHLATALKANQQNVLLMDLCSRNLMRLSLGMDWKDHAGWMVQIKNNHPWYEACYQDQEGLSFIPFGQNVKAISSAYKKFINDKTFKLQFEQLNLPSDCYIILDCSSDSQINYSHLFKQADIVLHVTTADANAYACTQQLNLTKNHSLLINQFNPLLALERDLNDIFHADFTQHLVPVALHRDESIREALAHKQTAIHCAPNGQAAHDFRALALWLKSKIGAPYVA